MKWFTVLMLLVGAAHANTQRFDAQMAPVATAYVKIHAALFGARGPNLFGDAAQDIDQNAAAIVEAIAKVDPKAVTGEHAAHYAGLPEKIAAAATAVKAAPDLAAKREAFKELSRPIAMWVSMSKPAGYRVGYCPMVKASWIQTAETIQNPYEPKTMPTCGSFVGGDAPVSP